MKTKYPIAIFVILVVIISCSKYEEGPFFSLRSKKARLLGEWRVVEFMKDEEDLTAFYQDSCGCDVKFDYDEVVTQGVNQNIFLLECPINAWNFGTGQSNCGWKFTNDKKYIMISLGHNNNLSGRRGMYPLTICYSCSSDFEILLLKNDELWLKYNDVDNEYTIKFEKK